MKKTFSELREFMLRGNVVDLAVGVIVGGAFGKIVSSLVNDVIMPPIGVLLGGVNFTDLRFILKAAAVDATGAPVPAVSINYGTFLQTVLDFSIIAVVIFFAIKGINSLKKKKEEVAPPVEAPKVTKEQELLAEIRDLLKQKK